MSLESLPVKHRDRNSRKNSKILHGKIFKHAEKNRVKHGKLQLVRKKKTKSRLSEREAKEQAMERFISDSNDNEDESKNNKENSNPNQSTRKEDSSDPVSQLNDKIANIKATLNDDTKNNKRKMTNICQTYLSIQQILLSIHQSQSTTKKQLNGAKVCKNKQTNFCAKLTD